MNERLVSGDKKRGATQRTHPKEFHPLLSPKLQYKELVHHLHIMAVLRDSILNR